MKFVILDVYPAKKHRLIKDTAGGYGTGNDFGDLTTTGTCSGGVASSTRGLWWGGRRPGGGTSNLHTTIQYVTISSTGNSFIFGDLTYRPTAGTGASNNTRGIFAGGYAPSDTATIEYIAFATEGAAVDFGDLTDARGAGAAMANSHGGLG